MHNADDPVRVDLCAADTLGKISGHRRKCCGAVWVTDGTWDEGVGIIRKRKEANNVNLIPQRLFASGSIGLSHLHLHGRRP